MGCAEVILLDTHVVLWLAEAPELLSKKAYKTIAEERQDGVLSIADITLWEIAMLISRGRVRVKTSLGGFLRTVEDSFSVLPLTSEIAERSIQFTEQYPKDPTDRLIGAAALVHGVSLVTRDEQIRQSGEIRCIW
jgi:PIN domain nuclease of toxin-antitoxin system